MKSIIPVLILLLIYAWHIAFLNSKYDTQQHTLQQQEAKIDSLQSQITSLQNIVDNCEARVNDMRLQRDHAIETNRWHEIKRVRPK